MSDSLAWGNRHGVLDALFGFAREHPNARLELKTKSDRIDYLLRHEIPHNVVCSWWLNTDTIIRNEEHGTATLNGRLQAARARFDPGRGTRRRAGSPSIQPRLTSTNSPLPCNRSGLNTSKP